MKDIGDFLLAMANIFAFGAIATKAITETILIAKMWSSK